MPITYGANPSTDGVHVESRHHRTRWLTEIDVVELERQELVQAITGEELVRGVILIPAVDGVVDFIDVVDLRIELADAATEVQAAVSSAKAAGAVATDNAATAAASLRFMS